MTVCRAVDYLRERGHLVDVVRPRQRAERGAPPRVDELLVSGMGLPLYPGVRFGFPAATRLEGRWRACRPDLVHIATEGPLGWSALRAATALGIPVTSDYRTHFQRYSGHYGVGWMARPIDAYLRAFHNRAHMTFVSTTALEQELAGRGYRNLAHVGRGIDTELFNPERRSDALRARWGLAPSELAVVHVGRIAAEKNLQVAVRAFERIRAVRPDARMLWVGDGPQRAKLAQRHRDHLFVGMKHGEELATHYASADLFLFPSLTETFGNVTLEALASGLALVAFNDGAAAQHVRDGVSGRLVDRGDEEAFCRAAAQVASSRDLLARIRAAAVREVAALTWPVILRGMERHLLASAHGYRLYANALVAG